MRPQYVHTTDGKAISDPEWKPSKADKALLGQECNAFMHAHYQKFRCVHHVEMVRVDWEKHIAAAATGGESLHVRLSGEIMRELRLHRSPSGSASWKQVMKATLDATELALASMDWEAAIEKANTHEHAPFAWSLQNALEVHVRDHGNATMNAHGATLEAIRLNGFEYLRDMVSSEEFERFKADRPH